MIKKLIFLFLAVLFVQVSNLYSQCEGDCNVMEELSQSTFLKNIPVQVKKGKDNQTYSAKTFITLNQGSNYKFIVCNNDSVDSKMIIDILDKNGKIASNYNFAEHTYYSAIIFACEKPGVYFLNVYFENFKEGCGSVIMALDRK